MRDHEKPGRSRSRSAAARRQPANDARAFLPGRKPFIELVRHRPKRVRAVLVAEDVRPDAELAEALERCRNAGVAARTVRRADLDSLFEEVLPHQGIVAEIDPAAPVPLEKIVERALAEEPSRPIVLLDQVADPRNLGSIFRAADAAGAAGIAFTADRSAPVTAVTRKVSAGATEVLPYTIVPNLQQAIRGLKERGFWIIGAALGQSARPLFESDLPAPFALVLGSEGRGLRRLTEERCDLLLSLPMCGSMESLNVGQAAAVFLFEILRRRSS